MTWSADIFVEEDEVHGRLEPFFVNKFRHHFGRIEKEIGDALEFEEMHILCGKHSGDHFFFV